MLEKEIKLLEIDVKDICKKLEDLGAKQIFYGVIHDVYYDFPNDGKEHKMKENERMFRVRKKGETHLYTIKKKRRDVEAEEDVVAKDEHEMEITDVESFSGVLEKYGMIKTREKIKHRISYNLDGAEFDIDEYEGIPPLLEIEETHQDRIEQWIKALDLKNHKRLLGGSKKLFKYYGVAYRYFD